MMGARNLKTDICMPYMEIYGDTFGGFSCFIYWEDERNILMEIALGISARIWCFVRAEKDKGDDVQQQEWI